MKKLLLLAVVVLAATGTGAYALSRPSKSAQTAGTVTTQPPAPTPDEALQEVALTPQVTTVKYGENGFEPRTITIKQGTEVTFINNTEVPLWAVTDPHPDHTDYPEFDAAAVNEALPKPGEDFVYTFNKPGTWGYHNHARPEHTGTVIVE